MAIQVRKIYRSPNVCGAAVKGVSGEDIGKIEEIAINMENGKIA